MTASQKGEAQVLGEVVPPVRASALATLAQKRGRPWLMFDPAVLEECYNRRPFILQHRLPEHPLFQLDQLFALCRRLPSGAVKVRIGKVPGDAEFDSSLGRYNQGLTLEAAIDNLEERQAYIAIYNPETDPAYRTAIDEFLGEINLHVERLEAPINWYSTYVFISARDSVTPYHMDREMNFLLQVRGTKTVKLWDALDDDVMSSAQKDQLLAAAFGPRPLYHPDLERKAMVYELRPGLGVHHPFIAPHLVTTGPALSISLAITFRTRQSDVWTEAHALNHRLRRIGLAPSAVRRHPSRDEAKARVNRMLQRVRRLVQTRATGSAHED